MTIKITHESARWHAKGGGVYTAPELKSGDPAYDQDSLVMSMWVPEKDETTVTFELYDGEEDCTASMNLTIPQISTLVLTLRELLRAGGQTHAHVIEEASAFLRGE